MAGKGKPRRAGPLSMQYDAWINAWAEGGCGRAELLLLLKLCERLEFDGRGRATSWYPRGEMAAELGMAEDALKRAAGRLKKRGFLDERQRAHNGRCEVYAVMPQCKWPAMEKLAEDAVGGAESPPKGGREDAPLRREEGLVSGLARRLRAGTEDAGTEGGETVDGCE